MPANDDPPLNLNVPKPSFANTMSRSAFGFQSMAISETVQTDCPQDAGEDSDMDDIYEDANEVDKNANITNEGEDEAEDGLVTMNDGGNDSFLFLSMGSHSLPERDDVQANIEAGNLGSPLRKKKYDILILISSRIH